MQPPQWFLRPGVTYLWLALTIIAFSIKHWTGLAPRRVPSEAARYLFAQSDPVDRIFCLGPNSGNISRRSLAKLLAERYEPVAHTAEGVIYRMR